MPGKSYTHELERAARELLTAAPATISCEEFNHTINTFHKGLLCPCVKRYEDARKRVEELLRQQEHRRSTRAKSPLA